MNGIHRQDAKDAEVGAGSIRCCSLRAPRREAGPHLGVLGGRSRSAFRVGPGFTLVELLIAVALLSTAMMGIMAVFAAAANSHRAGVDGTEAAIIASSVVAEARTVFREAGMLTPAEGLKWPGRPRYSYDIEYVPLDKAGDELLMRVVVRWSVRGRGSSRAFDTILLRRMD